MSTFSFIARMPDDPGALHRAAEIIKSHGGNIHRVDYDRRIDPHIVFFQVDADEDAPEKITKDLRAIGYLQTSLATLRFLKFSVYLPDEPGMLFEFLGHTTGAGANIAFLDFDDRGKHPGRLTVALTLDNDVVAYQLLEEMKLRWRLEILEYDSTGKRLDDTVFYIRFAQELREIIGTEDEEFLFRLLHDSNHIAQELTSQGRDPHMVFRSILQTGRTLRQTTGAGFYSVFQEMTLSTGGKLYCFQLPCGGSVYVLRNAGRIAMFDTGFGIYHREIVEMLAHFGLDARELEGIFITHADADHSGGGALFEAPSYLHQGSMDIIHAANRAYGSQMEGSILGQVYTKFINLFSQFNPPTNVVLLPPASNKTRNGLSIMGEIEICGLKFEVLESLGGHLHGHVFYLCPEVGLVFTGDCLINFDSLTPEMEEFATLAKNLMTTVNVDSERARKERKALLEIGREFDDRAKEDGRRLLVCCGHGAVSTIEGNGLRVLGETKRYSVEEHYQAK
ncbi:MAG: MBL fold metallo-hydrolase [Methanomassiliicoccus sp.]|nr:MBL fold metallo-hydrolase [Methanomassiliicoccus sp.]